MPGLLDLRPRRRLTPPYLLPGEEEDYGEGLLNAPAAAESGGDAAPNPTPQLSGGLLGSTGDTAPSSVKPRSPAALELDQVRQTAMDLTNAPKVSLLRNILARVLGGLTGAVGGGRAGVAVRREVTGEAGRQRQLGRLGERGSILQGIMRDEQLAQTADLNRRNVESQITEREAQTTNLRAKPAPPAKKVSHHYTNADGRDVTVYDDGSESLGGQVLQKPEPKPKTPTATTTFGGKRWQWNPKTERYDIPLGAEKTGEGGGSGLETEIPVDSTSQNILAQTGLSFSGFLALTGQASKLPRDAATRKAAFKEAQNWSNKHNVDISTLASQYETYNKVLSANISRLNNTKIMEQELEATIQNLQGVVNEKDFGSLRFTNVVKIWAGQEVNDDLAQQYAMHLNQLRRELTAYNAATQGRSGNDITVSDEREAEQVIRNGIARGSLVGLATAVKNSTEKMGKVMRGSVDRARKSVWELFGVGNNYGDNKQGDDTVRMVGPDGTEADVPRDKVEAAKAAGAKVKVKQ